MPDGVAQKTRQAVEHPLTKSLASSDRAEKRPAPRVVALAQSAETAEWSLQQDRGKQQQTCGQRRLDENLRLLAETNLRRFLGCLYVETDKAQREMYWNLLVQEQRWFAAGDDRAVVLERLFRDCSDRVQRQTLLIDSGRDTGVDLTRNETFLNNMLKTQAMLRELLQNELRRA